MDVFRVRLNCIDHYQAVPSRLDPRLRNDVPISKLSKEPQVPVIRVFGSTETGQKVCAHIHGAFPYLFIEYRGSLDKSTVGEYISRLHTSIDCALSVSYRRDGKYGNYKEPRFVARITLVKGIPFYGFHVGYCFYLKIYMLNPLVMTRLADMLQQGSIMGCKFQPYEAHLQYLLQFMTDYNLYGCGYIETNNVLFRAPVPEPENDEDAPQIWDSDTIPSEQITDDLSLPRSSHCSIEVDICVQDIMNRRAVKERPLHHDFIEKDRPLPSDLKLVHSMAGLWRDETKRRRRRMGNPDPGSSIFPSEVLVSMSADPRCTNPPGWIHEDEHRHEIQRLIAEEDATVDGTQISFWNYVQPRPFEETVKTVLESVEDLYPENLFPVLGLKEGSLQARPEAAGGVEADEKGILEFGVRREAFAKTARSEKTVARESVQDRDAERSKHLIMANNRRTNAHQYANQSSSRQGFSLNTGKPRIRTINGLSDGIAASGLRSGKRPEVPLFNELIAEAEEMGLFSKAIDTRQLKIGEPAILKRPGSALGDGVPLKRIRIAELDRDQLLLPPSSQRDNSHQTTSKPRGEGGLIELARTSQSSQPARPTAKAAPRKQGANQSLNFSVVKDPHDINTVLRLSQHSGSQPSQDSPMRKQVSFDPLLSLQESAFESTLSPKTPSSRTSSSTPKTPELASPGLLWSGSTTMFLLNSVPPSLTEVCSSMHSNGMPDVIYQDAFYSLDKDVPPRSREYAGREYRLRGSTVPYLPEFEPSGESLEAFGIKPEGGLNLPKMELEFERQRKECTLRSWEIADPPPTFDEVNNWWAEKQDCSKTRFGTSRPSPATQMPLLSQIVGSTPKNKHSFKYSQKQKSTSVQHETQYMSTMSLELHVNTRGKVSPNPKEDAVQCLFWCLKSDESAVLSSSQSPDSTLSGVVVLSEDGYLAERIRRQTSIEVLEEASELEVLTRMVEIVRSHDPDILTGYEVHGSSWGYLIERAGFKYDYDLCSELSRMKSNSFGKFGKGANPWGFNTTSSISVTGRHMINIWRSMRGELNLLQYTMENVAWHLLHRRVPHYTWRTLTDWYTSGRPKDLSKVLRYYTAKARLDIEILEANELVPRTSEQARLLGVDFFSVFSRGSQFKVESIMFRIAKPENFILVSPSRKQVGGQNALECLPLVMEPQSAFYTSPLLVLDFQSLYPSVMIAYNYCYSTFLGRIVNWRGTNKMGFAEYKRREGLLRLLKDYTNVAPNGVMYTKAEIRKSLLAKMLTEILETRVMVKSGMKQDKDDKALQQLLNNRQLALKLLANVTYGYTSASFSGRMPCSEIADSIVQTGRETLERAIAYIHSVERWGAEVVYGDTDSLFIYLKGRTREQAFEIGAEMAKEITDMNPRPIKLKFEKVYHPCVLLAKKRYVGYKFESPDQTVPEFDAKGIETVRRDGTPAEQKIEEKALKILFETADLSQVKAYFQAQCAKIMRGQVSVQDFCFAREVKLGTYSARGPPPPGALISTRRMLEDARAEPQYGERVPYVVITGGPRARLIDRCVAPEDLLASEHLSLDSEYYIGKNIIPPLERIFNLVGANVRGWYDEMPKIKHVRKIGSAPGGCAGPPKRATLEWFLRSASCVSCGVKMKSAGWRRGNDNNQSICRQCAANKPKTIAKLQGRVNVEMRKYADVVKVCQSCAGMAPLEEVPCDSKDCPVFYTRVKQAMRLGAERASLEPVVKHLTRELLDW